MAGRIAVFVMRMLVAAPVTEFSRFALTACDSEK
jgi:hypothetical protein